MVRTQCTSPFHGIGRAAGRVIGRGIVAVLDIFWPLPAAVQGVKGRGEI